MIEPIDADVSRIIARAPSRPEVVAEDRCALMFVVLPAQSFLRRKECVPAAGVDHISGEDGVTAAVIRAHIEPSFARPRLLGLVDFVALARIRAAFARVLEEHLVEILPPNLISVRRAIAERAVKCIGVVAALVVRLEIGARFEHAEGTDLFQDAQPLEYR